MTNIISVMNKWINTVRNQQCGEESIMQKINNGEEQMHVDYSAL